MNRKKMVYMSVIGAVLLMAFLFVTIFFDLAPAEDRFPIVLPDTSKQVSPSGGVSSSPGNLPVNMPEPVDITPKNALSVVASLTRTPAYSAEFEVMLASGKDRYTLKRNVRVKNGYTRIDTLNDNGEISNTVIAGEGRTFSWTSGSGAILLPTHSGPFSPDDYANIPTYEELVSRDSDFITDAGYDYFNGEHVIYILFHDDEIGYDERYYISLTNGILCGFERTLDNELRASATLLSLDTLAPGDLYFNLPDGQPAWDYELD